MAENDQIIMRMQSQVELWQAGEDRRATFLACYQMMTSNMLASIQTGEFNDPDWVYSLLNHFAGYYFNALDAYEQDLPDTPQVWRDAFDSARQPDTRVLQNLLLGVNAHINHDLIFALEDMLNPDWQQLDPEERQGRYDDHCHVNDIIQRTIDAVQDAIIEPQDPLLKITDRLFGEIDERIVARMISNWRDEVWEHARQLLELSDEDERQDARRQIENETLKRARMIQQIIPDNQG